MEPNAEDLRYAGLCSTCRNARVLTSDRGSRFYQCTLGLSDPSFRKYPILPVRQCRGYEVAGDSRRSEESC